MIYECHIIINNIKNDMKIDTLTPDKIILTELGQRLARVRKQQGFSQTVLAQEAGLGVATLRRIESGHSGQMESWLKIMKALRMTAAIDTFLPEKFDSPRSQVLSDRTGKKKTSKMKPSSENGVAESSIKSNVKWGDQIR
jgi:transcriptional regulator with XRE-family HTH domain